MIKVSNLTPSLAILSNAIGKSTMPILSCIRVRAEDGKLHMTASNLEMQIDVITEAETKGKTEFCADAKKLTDFAKISGSKQIEIKIDKEKLAMKAKSRSNINFMPFDNFPDIEVDKKDCVHVTLDAALLSEAISQTSVSVALNDVRFFLNGFNLNIKDNIGILASSDGHRLSKYTFPVVSDGDINCIIPKQTGLTISKLFNAGDITLALNRDSVSIDDGTIKLLARNIDAKYPDFSKVFSQTRQTLKIIPSDFISGLEAAGINANAQNKGIRLEYQTNLIKMSGTNENGEESSIDVPCEYSGSHLMLAYNMTYLIEAAKRLKGNIELGINETSILLTGEDDNAIQLVMPMRL